MTTLRNLTSIVQQLSWRPLMILLLTQGACRKENNSLTRPAAPTTLMKRVAASNLPLQIGGILCWYDVTDTASVVVNESGKVTTLKDKSGQGYTMTGCYDGVSYPVYHSNGGANDLPYMKVTPGTELLPVSKMPLDLPYTIYYVMKNDSFVNHSFVLGLSSGNSSFVGQDEQSAGHTITLNSGAKYCRNANGYHEQWQVLSLGMENNTRLQVNNEAYLQPQYSYDAGFCGNSAGDQVGFAPYYKNGYYSVEELIVYKGTVTATNDSLIRDYLVKKYAPKQNKVYLWFGDSITWGAVASDPDSSSFVALIAKEGHGQLINYGFPGSVAVEIPGGSLTGVPGRDGTDLYTLPFQEKIDLSNTFVFFEYGSNDRNNPLNSVYVDSFEIMIQVFLDHGVPHDHIMVCTNPARSTGGPSVIEGLDSTMYQTLKKIANDKSVRFFDCWAAEAANWSRSFIYSDGIHLTDQGMRAYADGVEAILSSSL